VSFGLKADDFMSSTYNPVRFGIRTAVLSPKSTCINKMFVYHIAKAACFAVFMRSRPK
jgi:hypothetical protein